MPRAYERSHPWLTFRFDSRRLQPATWMLLGEARSKFEHIGGVPLQPDVAERLYRVSLAKGVHATTAIEGNTLSADDVEKRLAGKLEVPESKAYLVQEIDNILSALNDVIHQELVEGRLSPLSPQRIKLFNKIVLRGLKLDEDVVPGEVRRHSVGVGRYRGAPAEDCEFLLERLCNWLNGPDFDSGGVAARKVPIAILKAVLGHLYLEWIHPFGDGNGRTGRLIEVQVLAEAGVPDVACQLLSNHYNDTRAEYYRQLNEASASGGNVAPFIEYAVQGLVEGLTRHIEEVRLQQWDVSWTNHVHLSFKGRNTRIAERQRELVLELSKRSEPVSRRDLTGLSPALARAYAGTTDKTVSRDLNALEEMHLIRRTPEGFVAQREFILAFLPVRNARAKGATKAAPDSSAAPAGAGSPQEPAETATRQR